LRTRPEAERAELVDMLAKMGMTEKTAQAAADEIHRDEKGAISFHLVQELGVDPTEKPSPLLVALWSFVMFAVGAVIPLTPYLLGYESLAAGLACAGIGLVIAGGLATRFTRKSIWWGASRQLLFGTIAIAATYLVGRLVAAGL
jgi:VIT1/CCC1 family predicted Fe2+/Mn2+ transporter